MENKAKKHSRLSRWVILFIVTSIFTFTGLAMYVQIISGIELSATLITCFFGFCTGELWMLASIKKAKINTNFVDDPNTPENEAEIYSEIYNQGVQDAMAKIKDVLNNGGNDNE